MALLRTLRLLAVSSVVTALVGASDDEFLEFLGIVKDSTGRNDLEGRNFCDDLVEFTS
jgi:hypothetical protein